MKIRYASRAVTVGCFVAMLVVAAGGFLGPAFAQGKAKPESSNSTSARPDCIHVPACLGRGSEGILKGRRCYRGQGACL